MKRFLLFFAAIVLLLTACQPPVTAQSILEDASQNMTEAESVKFELTRIGEPVQASLGTTSIGVAGATGEYQAPDKVHAVVKATMGGLASEGDVLWIGDIVYFQHPFLSPEYTAIEVEGFDAPGIFSATNGIPQVLKTLTGAELGDTEDIDGVQAHHINATAPGSSLTAITGAPVAEGDVRLDIWIATETMQVVRVLISEENDNGWQLDFFDYGVPVEIPEPPAG
jgi:hypothetical protein